MQSLQKNSQVATDATCQVIEPSRTVTGLSEDVRSGLLEVPRSLPPKYFYDERGSQLFDKICTTPEYYLTRIEDGLLVEYAKNIISETSPDLIIELGSGTSKKTRRLFDACESLRHKCNYAPFDVCEPMLNLATNELNSRYDWLSITPMLGDYHAGLANLPTHSDTNLVIFLGSTIGNFSPDEAQDFVKDLRDRMSVGDYFLLGADRVKDIGVLNAAYNDSQGLTAEFNLNVLRVLNREIGSNFVEQLRATLEMYLVSLESQDVRFDALQATTKIEQGESILTEISRKFEAEDIESLFADTGFDLVQHYQAENEYFSLILVAAS